MPGTEDTYMPPQAYQRMKASDAWETLEAKVAGTETAFQVSRPRKRCCALLAELQYILQQDTRQ